MTKNNTQNPSEKCATRGIIASSGDEWQAFCSRILGVIRVKRATLRVGAEAPTLKVALVCDSI